MKQLCVDEAGLFQKARIGRGERWIFSADFNIKNVSKSDRVDEELADILRISESGGITVILAHQGRYGEAKSLDFVANYISETLRRKVHYFPENSSDAAFAFVEKLKPGEIALMGNTRFNEGEERNAPELAYTFAHLGDNVVVGGFGKAHRMHASNYGVLDYRRGYLGTSQFDQMRKLEDWKGQDSSYSVAVLGGVKKEKILLGLKGFAPIYDAIIPGGIVLNTILKCIYGDVGQSVVSDKGSSFVNDVEEVLAKHKDKLLIPIDVIVAREEDGGFVDQKLVNLGREKVPDDCKIISYRPPYSAELALGKVAKENGRLVIAGTPDVLLERADSASQRLLYWIERMEAKPLILGGDTARELNCRAIISSGGGSALMYLTQGTTFVYEKLKENFRERGRA
jgi:phosphoglycerate kinase